MTLHKLFSQPSAFGADDFVGRVRSGAQVQGRPVALSDWRITTGDPEVAEAISSLYGGSPSEWETTTEEKLEVMTTVSALPVLLTGIQSEFVLWGRNNKPIRRCDGTTQKDDKKSACVCPLKVSDHKEEARAGSACSPSVRAMFRMADLPDLGLWRFNSQSWQLAASINEAEDALAEAGGEATGILRLQPVEYETAKGRLVSYTKPVIEITAAAAVA